MKTGFPNHLTVNCGPGSKDNPADVKKNLVYFRSPIGKSLIGKKVKDSTIVNTPSGEKIYEILEVKYI